MLGWRGGKNDKTNVTKLLHLREMGKGYAGILGKLFRNFSVSLKLFLTKKLTYIKIVPHALKVRIKVSA